MSDAISVIPITNVAVSLVPVAMVAFVMWRWALKTWTSVWATARMLLQLILIGYVLTFIFTTEDPAVVAVVLAVMLIASSWIALRPLAVRDTRLFFNALVSIAAGGLFTLALVILAVLQPEPWFEPRIVIPIAGMIFSSAMNTVSLAAERFEISCNHGLGFLEARRDALNAAMIPLLNMFFAVGLVALPGMMTGQILSGVAPHIAVRYQIVVMCMTFGAAGLAAIAYLSMSRDNDADKHRAISTRTKSHDSTM